MPEESKHDGPEADPLINAFADFGTTGGLDSAINEFIDDNCEHFEGAEEGGEMKLKWTDLHRQYVETIELHLETFCKEHETTAETMFQLLNDVNNDDSLNQDFVPQVIKLCEYPFFFVNMKEAADIRASKHEANALKSEDEFNLSGCYQLCTDLLNVAEVEKYYEFTGCPWYFRKIIVAASKKLSDIVVLHEPEEKLVFKYSLQFFGRKNKEYVLDDKLVESENMWGKVIETKCFQDNASNNVRIQAVKPSYAPDGYSENTFEWEEVDGERLMCWRRRIYESMDDKDPLKDNDGEPIGPALYFRPMEGTGSPSRK
ncbi:hypothetical protein TrLO_g9611 [Triparma laevis f. longispina]|uniref:Cilia- and flagella-associated protein 36 n=1 Tax=Triparma laevis f. longispina TaxID=1714387 RepID=A0A9W7B6Z9_9STRA|nr:hypothetical protein TrLO_g9611 [Triparma laevis f. longispina]